MIDPAAAQAAAASYAGLRLDRIGVPMILALLDETTPAAPVRSTDGDGVGLARSLDAYRAALRPEAGDGDLAALHHVLAVLSWVHRPGGPAALSAPGDDPPASGLGFARHRAALAAGRFVRVVNYHNTPVGTEDQLERDLRGYLERYDPITPDDLEVFFDTGRWPGDRPGFVAAFYDAYRNHTTVAAPVCDRLGLRAWFLPPTALLDRPPDTQHAFAAEHDVDVISEERAAGRLAMTAAELAAIGRRHVVAAHTATHASVEEVAADPDGELVGPRDRIAAITGATPSVVALRVGAPYTAGIPQWDAVRAAGYRFVVSNTAVQRI